MLRDLNMNSNIKSNFSIHMIFFTFLLSLYVNYRLICHHFRKRNRNLWALKCSSGIFFPLLKNTISSDRYLYSYSQVEGRDVSRAAAAHTVWWQFYGVTWWTLIPNTELFILLHTWFNGGVGSCVYVWREAHTDQKPLLQINIFTTEHKLPFMICLK